MEEWRIIQGFENYQVSNLGRVRGPKGILKPGNGGNGGYYQVGLHLRGKAYHRRVNRLVCQAFHGDPPFSTADALHKDDDRSNNTEGNLYWGTTKQNAADRDRNGRAHKGESHKNASLDWNKVNSIRKLYSEGVKPAELARMFETAAPNIHKIIRNQAWRV